jgi:5-methylcytosine-specific restriction endonuclease McrA
MVAERKRLVNSKRNLVASCQGWKCAICHETLTHIFDIDHIVPLHSPRWRTGNSKAANYIGKLTYENGKRVLSGGNLHAICKTCHSIKTDSEMIHYCDSQEEKRTRKSRYFNPSSVSYAPCPPIPKDIDTFLEQFRHTRVPGALKHLS